MKENNKKKTKTKHNVVVVLCCILTTKLRASQRVFEVLAWKRLKERFCINCGRNRSWRTENRLGYM